MIDSMDNYLNLQFHQRTNNAQASRVAGERFRPSQRLFLQALTSKLLGPTDIFYLKQALQQHRFMRISRPTPERSCPLLNSLYHMQVKQQCLDHGCVRSQKNARSKSIFNI